MILLLPQWLGLNGILFAQPIADVLSAVITVFMAIHLHRQLKAEQTSVIPEKQLETVQ